MRYTETGLANRHRAALAQACQPFTQRNKILILLRWNKRYKKVVKRRLRLSAKAARRAARRALDDAPLKRLRNAPGVYDVPFRMN